MKTGEDIESEFGIPIVNKRISVTPIALIAGSCETEDYVPFAKTLDRAARDLRCELHRRLFRTRAEGLCQGRRTAPATPFREALAETDLVCSSVNVGSTKAGINMDAVARMGRIIKQTAHAHA